MRRNFILIALIVLAANTYSQKNYRFTCAVSCNDYTDFGYGMKLGYKFGPGIEFHKENSIFSYGFDFLVTSKGTSGSDYTGKHKMEVQYLQVPANIGMTWRLSDKLNIAWTNSLYIAYAFRGKSKSNDYSYVSAFSDNNVWGDKIPRFDCGYITGISLERGRYALGLNTEVGFVPLYSESYGEHDDENFAAYNIGAYLSFTIRY